MKKPVEELKCPRLRELREEKRLTGDRLARLVGVTESCISHYETRGIERASTNRLLAIARVLETTPEYLLGVSDEKRPARMRVEFKPNLTPEQVKSVVDAQASKISVIHDDPLREEIIRRLDNMSVLEMAMLLVRLSEIEEQRRPIGADPL